MPRFTNARVQGLSGDQMLVLEGGSGEIRIPVRLFSASPRIYRLMPAGVALKHRGRSVEQVRVNLEGNVIEFVCSSAVIGELEVEEV